MRRLVALVMLLLSLVATKVAVADTNVTATTKATQLLGDAAAYWQRTPMCATYTILVGPITDQPAAAEAEEPGCWMRISERAWGEVAPWTLCVTVVHEYGHSLGEPHNTNPLSVMNPAVEYTTGKPAVCTTLEVETIAHENAVMDAKIARENTQEREALARERRDLACLHRHHHRSFERGRRR